MECESTTTNNAPSAAGSSQDGIHESDRGIYRATYAPDSDQLSIYPDGVRLHADTWKTMKGAGWVWCRFQERFKHKWSPSAEDLVLQLCETIDDEDQTIADRAIQRAERFEGYESNRMRDGHQAHQAAHQIGERFAGGQPILVGHHSERRARRDQQRMHRAMEASCLNYSKADYWQGRAQGVIATALHRDSVGTRRNRIKGLEKEERSLAQYRDRWPDSDHYRRWSEHVQMRLTYERTILQAQLEELGQADVAYEVGGTIGGALIVKVNKAKGSDEVNSLTVTNPKDEPTGTRWRDTYVLQGSKLHKYRYAAPTAESKASLAEWKASVNAAKPKTPPLVNCRETCELLAEIWTADNRRRSFTRTKVSSLMEMTQAAYSARSGGGYTICRTEVVNQHGTEYRNYLGGSPTDHQKLFRIRTFQMTGLDDRGDCPIFLTDKPEKKNPHVQVLRDIVARLRESAA